MQDPILTALSLLDATNDDHWTANGSPRMDVIHALTGDDTITRKMVTDANPQFTRQTLAETPDKAEDEVQPDPEPDPEPEVQDGTQPDPEPAVDAGPYILDMPFEDIVQSEERLMAYSAEALVRVNELTKQKKVIEDEITLISDRSAHVTMYLQRMKRARPNSDTEGVRSYLEGQRQIRAERAARAQAFLERGVDANLLVGQLNSKSQLDQALNQRKPALGSTRPAMRTTP